MLLISIDKIHIFKPFILKLIILISHFRPLEFGSSKVACENHFKNRIYKKIISSILNPTEYLR